jgi:hypothetical protein
MPDGDAIGVPGAPARGAKDLPPRRLEQAVTHTARGLRFTRRRAHGRVAWGDFSPTTTISLLFQRLRSELVLATPARKSCCGFNRRMADARILAWCSR